MYVCKHAHVCLCVFEIYVIVNCNVFTGTNKLFGASDALLHHCCYSTNTDRNKPVSKRQVMVQRYLEHLRRMQQLNPSPDAYQSAVSRSAVQEQAGGETCLS